MSAVFWIVIGAAVIAACLGNKRREGATPSDGSRRVLRVDHPHYYDADDYECSVCGRRFPKESMVCPHCGARFTGTKEDNTEFVEEMMEEEDWDEEEGL